MTPASLALVPLGAIQTPFYIGIARVLREYGIPCHFFSFHERSVESVRSAGFQCESVFSHTKPPAAYSLERALAVMAEFDIVDANLLISHARAAYELRDGSSLVRQFAAYLEALYPLVVEAAGLGRRLHVVQELGGFLSVLASFYAARHAGVSTTFAEPSFYRGRVFLTRDSLAAPRPATAFRDPIPEVDAYLRDAVNSKQIVIPRKDSHHYRSAWRKVLNVRNVRRLAEKATDKYVRGYREEFGHVIGHAGRHLRMLVTAQRLRRHYETLPSGRFVYYPFHVPADVALTLRAPQYFDQCALIDYLARTIPATHRLAIKEHPALIGATSHARLMDLLGRYDNIVLLQPTINNHDVLAAADLVVTVNSKSGAEALLHGRRVVVLGDAFYRDSDVVRAVDDVGALAAVIRQSLENPGPPAAAVRRFFQSVWDASYPGELYASDPHNCRVFAASLLSALNVEIPGAA
jgi:hypothetical protein